MKITEIFRSLQGEGKNQGKPCLFIRLAGCNLNCRWCDTPGSQSGGVTMSLDTILEQVWRINPPYVCITGGEPLLQGEELERLLDSLHKRGTIIDIETNGTIDFSRFQPFASVCMDVKCPFSGEQSDLSLLEKLRPEDTVKFVVKDETDCQYAQGIIRTHRIPCEIFISPVCGTDYKVISEFILKNNLPARMQVQLHKVIGVK
ncbi:MULTISPECIES: radical SAM protein [unclassified Methanoregula]|uniref:7-carboxy-7-deazaguanine synthase QueE n=1 Tax=unclassified Methanoregula TaxID=2649730 RepID=UPI0009CDABB0|nr:MULTISPECIES: radical SAM protein [unclassified Methanoregula]OPX61682.1 MAG: pyruvate formate lyase II activase [Methanoregula sp. PtaB.Bin085]OPY34009.1 MAG: pyruvate formate lyase II activase [Methanoregula sp. PtaU1.Bin006]